MCYPMLGLMYLMLAPSPLFERLAACTDMASTLSGNTCCIIHGKGLHELGKMERVFWRSRKQRLTTAVPVMELALNVSTG